MHLTSFVAMLAVGAAPGCSGETKPGVTTGKVSCETNRDCTAANAGDRCSSGVCERSNVTPLPAQGAVAESIGPTAGLACQATTAEFTAPALVDPIRGTHASLYCDLSSGTGCAPNANVVVDGDGGASVTCSVTGSGDSFNVSANLSSGDVGFTVQGTIGATGGRVFLSSFHAQHGLQDSQCDITIEPNRGEIIPGAIWAAFNCPKFGDPSTGQPGCMASGRFIFENCDK